MSAHPLPPSGPEDMNGTRLSALLIGLCAALAVTYLAFQQLQTTGLGAPVADLAIEIGPDTATVAQPAATATQAAVKAGEEAERTRIAALGRSLLVEVVFPADARPEPDLFVVAVPAGKLDDGSAGAWLSENPGVVPTGGGRARVERNGRASIELPGDAGELALLIDARFLYAEPVSVPAGDETATIEPQLGACLIVELDVASGGEPVGALRCLGGQFDSRNRRGFERRTIELTDQGASEVVFGGLNPEYFWSLLPELETHHANFAMGLELEPGQERRHPLRLSAGASVVGLAVDPNGQPLAEANVSTRRGVGGPPWMGAREGVETDAEGRFEIRALPSGEHMLKASKKGFRETETEEFELAEGQRLEGLRITLDRGAAIAGVVVWPGGRGPASGALVVAEALVERRGFGSMSWSNVERASEAESDEDGRFVLSGLEEGAYTLRVRCDDPEAADVKWRATAADVSAPSTGLTLSLAGPLAFAGRVVDDRGEPVSEFELEVESAERGGPEESQKFASEDGTFVFARVGSGDWEVRVKADGHVQGERLAVSLPHDGSTLEIVLARTATIRGRVVDTGSGPVADAVVRVEDGRGSSARPWSRSRGPSANASEDGTFVLEDLRPGGFGLEASAEGWAASESTPIELAPGQELTDVTLFLRVGGRIEGVVVTPEGDPMGGQRVSYGSNSMGFGGEGSAKTDISGRFFFEHVTPGEWSVTASPSFEEMSKKMQSGAAETAFIDVMGEMITKTIEVADGETVEVYLGGEPRRPVRLYGVVERSGEPLAGAQVFAVSEGSAIFQGMKTAIAGGDGRYELSVDRPGAYVVSARLGRKGVEVNVDVPRQDEVRVDLFVPLGRIEGVVERPDGRPYPGAQLAIQREDGLGRMRWDGSQAVADDRGQYSFEDLEPGVYTVRANVSGFGGDADGKLGIAVANGVEVEQDRVTNGIDFRLAQAGSIEGLVRGTNGQPVARASIFFRDEAGRLVSAVSAASTDATGRFEQDGLAPGTYSLSVRSDDYASNDQAAVTVRSGEASEVELSVETGTLVRVKLVDPDGLAKRSRVEVFDRDGRDVSGMVSVSALRALFNEGASSSEHEVGPLPPGRYRVVATLPDGQQVDRSVRLRGEPEKDVTLKLD